MLHGSPLPCPPVMNTDAIRNKRLYIQDLARRLEAMERHDTPMNALAYRLYARRLRMAMAGYPQALLRAQLGAAHGAVLQVLDRRHFDDHGTFPGPGGAAAGKLTRAVLRRVARRTRDAK